MSKPTESLCTTSRLSSPVPSSSCLIIWFSVAAKWLAAKICSIRFGDTSTKAERERWTRTCSACARSWDSLESESRQCGELDIAFAMLRWKRYDAPASNLPGSAGNIGDSSCVAGCVAAGPTSALPDRPFCYGAKAGSSLDSKYAGDLGAVGSGNARVRQSDRRRAGQKSHYHLT